jgi:hypothetical protein
MLISETAAVGARGSRDLQRLPYLPALDRPTICGASDERDALSLQFIHHANNLADAVDYTFAYESFWREPHSRTTGALHLRENDLAGVKFLLLAKVHGNSFTQVYVGIRPTRNSLLWISVSSHEIVVIFQPATGL